MHVSKALSILLAIAAISTVLVGSAGFSSVSADRPVSVQVTADADAYVGYEPVGDGTDLEPGESHRMALVAIDNRLPTMIDDVTVSLRTTNVTVENCSVPASIPVGERRPITATLTTTSDQATVTVTVRIQGDDVAASIDGHVDRRTIQLG